MKILHSEYIAEIDGPQSRIVAGKRYLHKGGGSGSTYYANADSLYAEQAATARFMRGLGENYLPGATSRFATAAQQFDDPAYAERAVDASRSNAWLAINESNKKLTRDMARYGINPADGAWRSANNTAAMQGAALLAGSANAARAGVEDRKYGAAKDFYSALVGMPSDSASVAGSAASGYANLGMQADQRQANRNAAYGNIAALGYETLFAADGGEVKAKKRNPLVELSQSVWDAGERYYNRKQDGAVRMAMGGLLKPVPSPQLATAPQQAQQPSMVNARPAIRMGKLLKDGPSSAVDKLNAAGGRGMERVGNLIGSQQLAAEGIGRQAAASGTDLSGAINAYKNAGMHDVAGALAQGSGTTAVGGYGSGITAGGEQALQLASQIEGMGTGAAAATDAALATGAEAAMLPGAGALGATAAATEAAGTAGAVGAAGALGTAAAAIPWLGAAAAIGSLFDLFNEGGEVLNGRKDYTPGGDVTGPGDGTTTSDMVPAWLTDGEFVVNAEAVAMPGVRKALKMINSAGLAARGIKKKE